MTHHYDSSASGYISDSFEGISQTFTDVEILSTSEVNVVAARQNLRCQILRRAAVCRSGIGKYTIA